MSSEEPIVRLREQDGSEVERRLLDSASGDEMPDDMYRSLVEWSASPAAALDRAARVTAVAKGLGVIALVAASVGGFYYATSSSSSPPRATEASASPDKSAVAPPPEIRPATSGDRAAEPVPVVTLDDLPDAPSTNALPPPMNAPSNANANASGPRASEKHADSKPITDDMSIAEQMRFIDDARTKLRQGNPRAALAVLDAYEQRFPAPAFKEEATVLRVSSLAKAGDRAAAKRIGEAFLNAHPSELYSGRVEAIVRSLDQDVTP